MIEEDNPYTIRVVSDILESNGSSSMATVCAGTLALMDAGAKIKKPVSGIAMGLITEGEKYAVLSDILGDEDFLGDMDFKVCGTKDGITACQMDIKIEGLSYEILTNALEQSNAGRMHILEKLTDTIDQTRQELKPHVPKIHVMYIPKDTIGAVIGPGGKIIQQLQQDTETTITIEEVDEQGKVEILGTNQAFLDHAISEIKALTFTPEVGQIYTGTVRSIMPYGAFVNIGKGTDGLLHISEIKWERINNVEEVLKEGEKIEVKLTEIDAKSGKLRLSRKVLLPKPEKVNNNATFISPLSYTFNMRQLKITKQVTNRETASLDKYLQEIGRVELITAEEEVELAQRIKAGDDMALEKLTKANLRFVVSVAKAIPKSRAFSP